MANPSLFDYPGGLLWASLLSGGTGRIALPLAHIEFRARLRGATHNCIAAISTPIQVGERWRCSTQLLPLFGEYEIDADSPLQALIECTRILTWVLGELVTVEEDSGFQAPVSPFQDESWRAPLTPFEPILDNLTSPESDDYISVGRPRPNPNDPTTHYCPVEVCGTRQNVYATDDLNALFNVGRLLRRHYDKTGTWQ